MSQYTLLTLDLNDEVTSEARNRFYDELTKLGWKKVDDLTTLWYAAWNDSASAQDITNKVKSEVEKAANAAKVKHYDAALGVCGKPAVWKK